MTEMAQTLHFFDFDTSHSQSEKFFKGVLCSFDVLKIIQFSSSGDTVYLQWVTIELGSLPSNDKGPCGNAVYTTFGKHLICHKYNEYSVYQEDLQYLNSDFEDFQMCLYICKEILML